MILFDLIFNWWKPYRRLRKGTWTRATSKAPAGPTIWIRNHDISPNALEVLVDRKIFEREDYTDGYDHYIKSKKYSENQEQLQPLDF